MSKWYSKISSDPSNSNLIVDAVIYFEDQLEKAKFEVSLKGNVEKASSELPGLVERRFRELQEVEAILKFLEIQRDHAKDLAFRTYLENYNKVLSSRDAERYASGEQKVVDLSLLINQVAFIRNLYAGIMKGLDVKHWQINNVVKLRSHGIEDFEV